MSISPIRSWFARHRPRFSGTLDLLLQAFVYGIVFVALLLLTTVIYKGYFNVPPVIVIRLDPDDLGTLCPGELYPVRNHLFIEHPIVLLEYTSTLDETSTHNINNTQTQFLGRPNPRSGDFVQMLPWTVPDLPSGRYVRVLAIRGTNGAEDPIFIESSYTIGSVEDCK